MVYTTEELIPLVGRLAKKWAGHEHTSIPYERAQQLMDAVQYCIAEVEHFAGEDMLAAMSLSAEDAYAAGQRLVEAKVRQTLTQTNMLLATFDNYGNQYLEDMVVKGLPAFFKWYDPQFAPQRTILTLDYPLLADYTQTSGIDRIALVVDALCVEQAFLHIFSRELVLTLLAKQKEAMAEPVENLCEPLLLALVAHGLVGEPLSATPLQTAAREHLRQMLVVAPKETKQAVRKYFFKNMKKTLHLDEKHIAYLELGLDAVFVRLHVAATYGTLENIV
ncbi:MAG: DUF6179 domain-containing protein [Peptococcaceae bacterium]|nr:DUF6179 domain-containing protein [Peptococcaceae bacterium]